MVRAPSKPHGNDDARASSTPAKQNIIVEDRWLAEIMGRAVYRIAVSEPEPPRRSWFTARQYRRVRELQSGRVFLYAKVPTRDVRDAHILESLGFRLVDTNATFVKSVEPAAEAPPPPGRATGRHRVRLAARDDREQVVNLARRSFAYSRFHLDPAIPKPLADTIKARWVENYFHGARGDAMVVAETGGGITGFCLLLYGPTAAVIDLIAVEAGRRGQGIAGRMISLAESRASRFAEIRVGTQVANTASIRCYERLGFRLEESCYLLHYHNPPRINRRDWESRHANRRV